MRQSITTKYLGPTNSRGSRIKATARKRSQSYPEQAHTKSYGYEGTEQEHCEAARQLAEKLGWSGLWVGGGNVDEDGYVFVNLAGGFSAKSIKEQYQHSGIGREGSDWFYLAVQGA